MSLVLANIADRDLPRIEPRLIFFDVDGTLVNAGFSVGEGTRGALHELKRRGIGAALATGRSWFAARRLAREIAITAPSIFCSGALVVNPLNEAVLHEAALECTELQSLTDEAKRLGLYMELYSRDDYYIEAPSHLADIHAFYTDQQAGIVSFSDLIGTRPIIKAEFMADDDTGRARMRELAAADRSLLWSFASGAGHPEVLFANVTDKRATREAAFEAVLQATGLCRENTMAFGDSDSDIPMFKLAGQGIAMGNATPAALAAADYVTLGVEQDGVSYALERLSFRG